MKLDPFSNPGHLKLELFTYGLKIDSSCDLEDDARPILRTRGGLGSGLELILPGNHYVNVPIAEKFTKISPYYLCKESGRYYIYKNKKMVSKIKLPERPKFYDQKTSSGKLMSRIGVMQGTYLAIYPTTVCKFWTMSPKKNCQFCSIGLNLGVTEDSDKSVADVLEVVRAARKEKGVTFVHFNSGYNFGNEIEEIAPYVKAIKEKTGLLVGVQVSPSKDLSNYDYLKKLGVDHISICIEFFSTKSFSEFCPGKDEFLGRETFLNAIAYASKVFGKGRVAGEIIAGLEPAKDSITAIEKFAELGAISTVCVFRPCTGTDLEHRDPPKSKDIGPIFARMFEVCMENNIPVDIAPNVKVSLVILPYEGKYFIEKSLRYFLFATKMLILKNLFYLFFSAKIHLKKIDLIQKIKIYWQLIRGFTLFAPLFGILSGALISTSVFDMKITPLILIRIFTVGLAAALLNGASNVLNQVYDVGIDRINKPERPLTTGQVSVKEAKILSLVLYGISLIAGTFFSFNPFPTFILFLAASLLTIIYSMPPIRTKRFPFLSNLTIALARGLALILCGWSTVGSVFNKDPWLIGGIFTIFIFFAASTKDLHDIKGDKAFGIRTIPIEYGIKKANKFISIGFVLPFIILLGLSFFHLLSTSTFSAIILSFFLLCWGSVVAFLLLEKGLQYDKLWRHMYYIMLAFQVGLIIVYFKNK